MSAPRPPPFAFSFLWLCAYLVWGHETQNENIPSSIGSEPILSLWGFGVIQSRRFWWSQSGPTGSVWLLEDKSPLGLVGSGVLQEWGCNEVRPIALPQCRSKGLAASLCFAITLQVISALGVAGWARCRTDQRTECNWKEVFRDQDAAQEYSMCLACTRGSIPKDT